MEDCELMELPSVGGDFLWNNKEEEAANIQKKFDHCLANNEWNDIFPDAQVCFLPYLSSDHRRMLLFF